MGARVLVQPDLPPRPPLDTGGGSSKVTLRQPLPREASRSRITARLTALPTARRRARRKIRRRVRRRALPLPMVRLHRRSRRRDPVRRTQGVAGRLRRGPGRPGEALVVGGGTYIRRAMTPHLPAQAWRSTVLANKGVPVDGLPMVHSSSQEVNPGLPGPGVRAVRSSSHEANRGPVGNGVRMPRRGRRRVARRVPLGTGVREVAGRSRVGHLLGRRDGGRRQGARRQRPRKRWIRRRSRTPPRPSVSLRLKRTRRRTRRVGGSSRPRTHTAGLRQPPWRTYRLPRRPTLRFRTEVTAAPGTYGPLSTSSPARRTC
mmetsp:Transcript_23990/g.67195  ORF Transcript_23990/g.67195 Transcript_23990/m.67195 type:complete len:316 (+) Transcript_23990:408-1355(+)